MTSRIVSEISYPSSAAIGGNYSNDDRTLTGENFTVGGDTTITNCDVLLATGTPQDSINLTWDNDATITGTQGSLIFGSMMQAPVMDVATVSSGATFPAGMVLNVQSTTITTALNLGSVASGGTVQVTGLTVTITPKTTSSKMLLMYNVMASKSALGGMSNVILKRDSIAIGVATGTQSNQLATTNAFDNYDNVAGPVAQTTAVASGTFLDSPSTTSEITYKVFLGNTSSSTRTIYVNRNVSDGNYVYDVRGTSTLTVMEVAG